MKYPLLPLFVLFCGNLCAQNTTLCKDRNLDLAGQTPFHLNEITGPVSPSLLKFYFPKTKTVRNHLIPAIGVAEESIRSGIKSADLTSKALWQELLKLATARQLGALEMNDLASGAGDIIPIDGEPKYREDTVVRRGITPDGKYKGYLERAHNSVPGRGNFRITEGRGYHLPPEISEPWVWTPFIMVQTEGWFNRSSKGGATVFHPTAQQCRENTWVALDILSHALLNPELTPQHFMDEIALVHFITMSGPVIQSDVQNVIIGLLEASVRAKLDRSMGALRDGVDIYWEAVFYAVEAKEGLRKFIRDYSTFYTSAGAL